MRDRKLKLLPASIYDAAVIENWLAGQAGQGWLPVKVGLWTARMERGAPVECQYRLEPVDGAALIPDPALRDYYTEAGWEFVCFSANRSFRVWRSTCPDPVELHSDPEVEAVAYRRLSRRLYISCAEVVLYVLLWLFRLWPRPTSLAGRLEVQVFTAPGTWVPLVTLLCLCLIFQAFSGARAVCRLRKSLRQGIPLDRTRRCGPWRRRARAAVLAVLVLLVLLSICWRPSWQAVQPSELPVPPVEELGAAGDNAYLGRGGNFLASSVMHGIQSTKSEAVLTVKYAALRLPFLAEPLLAEMTAWWDPADRVTLPDSRFDEACYIAGPEWQQLALRRGGRVLYVSAKVPEDLRDHLDEYAAALR